MAIYRLLQNSAFEPEDVDRMVAAYESALRHLRLAASSEFIINELVAKAVISVAQTGVRDPERISALAIEQLQSHR